MQNFKQQVEWMNYFATQIVVAEMDEAEAESALNRAMSNALLASQRKLNEARAERDVDPEVVSLTEAYRLARGHRKALQVVHHNRSECRDALSRELTRRTEGSSASSRVDRWTP